jgi:hypothetical protein
MSKKQDYLIQAQIAVAQLYNCGAMYRETVPVSEVLDGQTVWNGDVEVFDLHGHPEAKRAYAWSHLGAEHEKSSHFVSVLELPPVNSARTAVQVQLLQDLKNRKEKPV